MSEEKNETTKAKLRKKAKAATYRQEKPAPSQAGREVIQVLVEDLPVELSKRELRELGGQLAAQTEEMEKHQSHAKDAKAELKSTEMSIAAQIKTLSLRIRSGTKVVPIQVHAEADFDEGVVRYLRSDTGEQIRTRPLAAEERQRHIPGTEPEQVGIPPKDGPDITTPALPEGVTMAEPNGGDGAEETPV
jgi:hypothetical protein